MARRGLALVFTLLAYPMGNVVPEMTGGATSAAFSGLWIHDAVGLFVTPLALAILYYVIPAASGRPIYSHFLSMLGFWGLFFFYPLNGTHHYVFSVIPMAAQLGAIAASALLGVIVVIVVTNLLLSLRGSGFIPRDPALRFVALSVVFYLGAIFATLLLPVPKLGVTHHGHYYGVPGEGEWVSHPYTVMAAGLLYFGALALSKLLINTVWSKSLSSRLLESQSRKSSNAASR